MCKAALKKVIIISMFTVMICIISLGLDLGVSKVYALPAGDGSANFPYLITNANDLKWASENIATIKSNYFKQINDIDCTGVTFAPIGNETNNFEGTYDGNGWTISNLNISTASNTGGLFGNLYISGIIKNVTLNNSSILCTNTGYSYVGGIVGRSYGTIQKCSVIGTSTVEGKIQAYAGGIVGSAENASSEITPLISDCYSTATIKGGTQASIGGIVGYSYKTVNVLNCYFVGSLVGDTGSIKGGIAANTYMTLNASNNFFLNLSANYGIGYPSSNTGASSKTSDELLNAVTFTGAGWDFSHVWCIQTGSYQYPKHMLTVLHSKVLTIPITEDFEFGDFVDWDKTPAKSGSNIFTWSCTKAETSAGLLRYPHASSQYMAKANVYSSGMTGLSSRLFIRNFNLPATGSYDFSFWMYHYNNTIGGHGNLDSIQPQVSVNGGVWQDLGQVIKRVDGSDWIKHTVTLDAYRGNSIQVGLLAYSDWGYNIYIDDISITQNTDVRYCTITYDPEDGTVNPVTQTKLYGSYYGKGVDGTTDDAMPIPTKPGYTFSGWYDGDNGTGNLITNATVIPTPSNQTLHAKWILNPQLTNVATSTDGLTLSLTFNKDMSNPSGNQSLFTVKADNHQVTISTAALATNPSIINLTVGQVLQGQTVTVAYTGSAGQITSSDGGILAAFADNAQTVANNSTEPIDNRGLNYTSSTLAVTPNMTVFGDMLYTTWVAKNGTGPTQIRVEKYDGTWSDADSGNAGSLNANTSYGAYNPVLIVYKSNLYVAWYEETGVPDVYQVYIRKYNGIGTNTWGSCVNLSYSASDSSKKAFNVKLAVSHDTTTDTDILLYAVWLENNGTKNQVRAKKYDGSSWSSGSWVQADGGTINYDNSGNSKATLPTVAFYNNKIFAAWGEKGSIRVKQYNGSSWISADTGSLNYATTKQLADMPILVNCSNTLYIIWAEQVDLGNIYQVRAKKYNGTSWDWVKDNGSLNYDGNNYGASMLNATAFNNNLYVAWTENNVVRIKKYDPITNTWTSADNGGIHYDTSKASSGISFTTYLDKLYVSWREGSDPEGLIRVKVLN